MSDPVALAVLADLFESTLGVAVEPHQLLSLSQFIKASTGPDATLHRRSERWSLMGARVVHDAALSLERLMREADDLDAQWTAARSMAPVDRFTWMERNGFNIGERL